jgi:hypothetical protein
MTCYLCTQPINARQKVDNHHPIYKSKGGAQTKPCHRRCHRDHHSKQGDFKAWGKKAAAKKRWAFHLLNVRTHPAYEPARQFYLMNYAAAGWSEGLV